MSTSFFKIKTNATQLESAIQMPRVPIQKARISALVCRVTLGMGKPVSGIKASIAQNLSSPKYCKHRENTYK